MPDDKPTEQVARMFDELAPVYDQGGAVRYTLARRPAHWLYEHELNHAETEATRGP